MHSVRTYLAALKRLAVAIVLATVLARPTLGEEVIRKLQLTTPLSPELQSVVDEAFPKDRDLKRYLEPEPYFEPGTYFEPDSPDSPASESRLPDIYGAFVDFSDKGDWGAIFAVSSMGWCGSAGCPVEILRKSGGTWEHVGGLVVSTSLHPTINVLRRTDHGFHRLDLGPDRDCEEKEGIVAWDGKRYKIIFACPEY